MSGVSTKPATMPKLAGLGIAAAGLTHFIRPQLFEPMTKGLFPRNTRQHIYTNGSIETALGLGLISRKTRKLALIGGAGYLGYLGLSAVRSTR